MNLGKAFEESTVVVVSALIASAVAYFTNFFPAQILIIIEFLAALSFAMLVFLLLKSKLSSMLWTLNMKRKLRKPIFGILKEEGCASAFTSFTPNDWEEHLRGLNVQSKFVKTCEIGNRFSVLINPYGEVYPEEELLPLKTFEQIKNYMREGGIFVCAGGLAFFYGGDLRSPGRFPALADEVDVLSPNPNATPGNPFPLYPSSTYPPTWSLAGTLLKKTFGVLTTWRDTERNTCSQTGTDRRYVGDIANIGNTNEVLHFRAVREPVRRCIPFLRVTPNQWVGDVYVIAGIPYGKGCLVVCGLDLRSNPPNPVSQLWTLQIHTANIDKVCHAVRNLVENRKRGNIPIDASLW